MTNVESTNPESEISEKLSEWNYHPALPITLSPVFDIPPKPKAALNWFINTWLKITPPVNHMIFCQHRNKIASFSGVKLHHYGCRGLSMGPHCVVPSTAT